MTLGRTSSFHILQQSPHDLETPKSEEPFAKSGACSWVPSRYNLRATTPQGRLVVWNTYTGALSVFEPEQKGTVELLLRKGRFEARGEGGVQYLHDRGYLLEEGVDEYKRFQLSFGRQQYRSDVLQLILLASEDCNFRCTYCYEKFARGTMQPWVRQGIKNLVRSRLPGLRGLTVSWFGGEPLYGLSAIEDLGPFFREITEEHSVGFAGSMTTNGFLLTEDVAENLLAWGVGKFQITLDGPPESHNRSRPARDGSATFETILANLRAMKSRADSFQIDLRVNFDRDNLPRMDAFLDFLVEEFGGDSRFNLRFRPVGQWGGARDSQLNVCDAEEKVDVLVDLKKEATRRGLTLTEDDDVRKLTGVWDPTVCYAARPYHFIIGATGKVMKCTILLDNDDRNVVGRVTEDGELELDEDKLAVWTAPSFETDTKCQKCVVLPICQGVSCPVTRLNGEGSPCISLRSTFKKELLQVAETDSAGRTRTVGVQPDAVPAVAEAASV